METLIDIIRVVAILWFPAGFAAYGLAKGYYYERLSAPEFASERPYMPQDERVCRVVFFLGLAGLFIVGINTLVFAGRLAWRLRMPKELKAYSERR